MIASLKISSVVHGRPKDDGAAAYAPGEEKEEKEKEEEQ